MGDTVAVPRVVGDLTPAWLSRALGAEVTDRRATQLAVGEGFIGQLWRLELEGHPSLPASVVAKLPTTDPGGRAIGTALRLYERESQFYRHLAARSPLSVPVCHHNVGDAEAGDWCLLLEDVAPAVGGDQVAGASADRCREAVTAIARFHATWAGHRSAHLGWMPHFDDATTRAYIEQYPALLPVALERYHDRWDHEVAGWGRAFHPRAGAWLDEWRTHPATVVHGDFRLDNMLFRPDGSLTLIDWQLCCRAPGIYDLVYFLVTNVETEVRRPIERELFSLYRETQLRLGHDPGTEAELFDAAREVFLLLLVFGAVTVAQIDPANERGLELFWGMFRRGMQAARDWDLGALV